MTVLALLARCDLVTREEYRATLETMGFRADGLEQALTDFDASASFSVAESVLLDDGRQVPWRDDRSFSIGACWTGVGDVDVWQTLSAMQLVQAVHAGVVQSTAEGVRDTQEEIVALLRQRGVDASVDELRDVRLRVVFSDRLARRLESSAERDTQDGG